MKGVILSGSPCSVRDANAPQVNLDLFKGKPLLGICYGAQYLAQARGGKVEASNTREYGRAMLNVVSAVEYAAITFFIVNCPTVYQRTNQGNAASHGKFTVSPKSGGRFYVKD